MNYRHSLTVRLLVMVALILGVTVVTLALFGHGPMSYSDSWRQK